MMLKKLTLKQEEVRLEVNETSCKQGKYNKHEKQWLQSQLGEFQA